MTAFAFWNPSDQLFVWGANVLLQITIVMAAALLIAALVRRTPAVRYGVLHTSLLLMLFVPAIAVIIQSSGNSFFSVSLMNETLPAVNVVAAMEPSTATGRT